MQSILPLNLWLYGAASYFVCHLLHIACWRRRPSWRSVPVLIFLLFIAPSVFYGAIAFSFSSAATSCIAPWLVHFVLALNYLAIYPAFQASSPTIHLLHALKTAPNGLPQTTLITCFAVEGAVGDRIQDLRRSKLLVVADGSASLSPAGRGIAWFFILYRRLLGLPEGLG